MGYLVSQFDVPIATVLDIPRNWMDDAGVWYYCEGWHRKGCRGSVLQGFAWKRMQGCYFERENGSVLPILIAARLYKSKILFLLAGSAQLHMVSQQNPKNCLTEIFGLT